MFKVFFKTVLRKVLRLAKFWSSRNELTARDVFKSISKKFWFDCNVCTHEFEKSLNNITTGYWCPYCGKKILCKNTECRVCFNNSFASSDKAKFWSSRNELTARNVFKSGGKKFWFECDVCGHDFESSPHNISSNGCWCPYCGNHNLCNEPCKFCFNNSFASSDKAIYWSIKNADKPRDVCKSSNSKRWFNCFICEHNFENNLLNITSGQWCSYCGHSKLCDNIDCKFCFNNSFASSDKAIYWSIKNADKPRDVFKSSDNKFWFVCSICKKDFKSAGKWCPHCVNKIETKLFNYLITLFKDVIKQFKVDWCKNKNHLPFDFCIEELKLIIELDGQQHFYQIANWKPHGETREMNLGNCPNFVKGNIKTVSSRNMVYI